MSDYTDAMRKDDNGNDRIKACPFCGSKVDFMTLMTGLKMFYCKNYKDCGAVVSFDNPAANHFDKAKVKCWNRRTGDTT